jgi:hypothetical protein
MDVRGGGKHGTREHISQRKAIRVSVLGPRHAGGRDVLLGPISSSELKATTVERNRINLLEHGTCVKL